MDGPSWTRGWEGNKLVVYDDATGDVLAAGEHPEGTATAGRGHTGPDVIPGDVWTQARVDDMFDNQDYPRAVGRASVDLAADIDDVRMAVLVDMAFEMGGKGLADFPNMLQSCRDGDWQGAHDNCLASKYDRQSPRRAAANAQILLTGIFPSPHPNDSTIV